MESPESAAPAQAAGRSRRILPRRWSVFLEVVLLLAGTAAVLLALAPVMTSRLLHGHHPEFHAVRILLVGDSWHAGDLIPRWVPALGGGLGYPLFIYYGWLSFALGADAHVLGLEPVAAMNAVTVAAAVWQAAGAWLLGRDLGGRAGAWVAWALFFFAPYQLVNIYVRGNFPEVVAGSFAPWALWMMARTVRDGSRWALVACSVFLAAIILSHNISGLTLGGTTLAAGLVLAATRPAGQRRKAAVRAGLAAVAAVLLCALFWVPILALRNEVNLHHDFQGYLDYRQHFLHLPQLVGTGWGYGFSEPGPADTMPLQLGVAHVAVLLVVTPLALLLAGRGSRLRRWRLGGFALLALALAFLTTYHAAPIWTVVRPLQTLQFPWRLHLPGTLMTAAAGALAVRVFAVPRWRHRPWLRVSSAAAAVLAFTLAVLSFGYCRPITTYACDEQQLRLIYHQGYYTTAMNDEFRPVGATDPAAIQELLGDDRLRLDGVPIPGAELPPWEDRRAFTIDLAAAQAGELRVPIFWFPGWSLTLDGRPQPAYPCTGSGAICTRVEAGAHQLGARWRPTPVYHAGTAISVLTLAGLAFWARRRRRHDG